MIRIFNHYVPRLAFVVLIMDALLLAAAAGPVYTISAMLSMAALGWYPADLRAAPRDVLRQGVARMLPGLLAAVLLVQAAGNPAQAFAATQMIFLGLGAACVLLVRLALCWRRAHPAHPANLLSARLLLVGDGELARVCLQLACQHRLQVVGCVAADGGASTAPGLPCLATRGKRLRELARAHGANEIVICVEERRGGALSVEDLLECTLDGMRVIDAATLFEREACQIRIDSLPPSYLIFGGGFDQGWLRAGVKRGFDMLASAALGLLALPVMAVAALCIRLEDGGPVFYRQQRVGKNSRLFFILKFRSMRADAERDGEPRWASSRDQRVTRTGAWLRHLRIDELPQLFNVLAGDMSLVGPRPERPYFVDRLSQQIPYYDARHSVKPGITGLAQVRLPYGASVADAAGKLQYDLYYVKNNSLFLDLLLLVETVHVVLSGRGSR